MAMYSQATVNTALHLSAVGVLDRENAQICGVSVAAIRHWRSGRRRVLHGTVDDRRTGCPRCHGRSMDESAYAYLLGLYLGDGHIARGRRDVYALSIACSDDWPGLIRAARRALSAVMPASRVCYVQQPVTPRSKVIRSTGPACFRSMGQGASTIEKSSWSNGNSPSRRKYPGELARGLFHSDGWRGVNRVRRRLADGDRWYEYQRYLFGNESRDILRLCGETLDQLGVAWRFSRRNAISVARREAVARLDEVVGPKY